MKKILVVAAHPDDEVLGCGATMAKHIAKGDDVCVVIAAEGITSRNEKRDVGFCSEELKKLRKISLRANAILGVKDVRLLAFPDNRMDSLDLLDIIKKIEEIINEFKPDTVYTHFSNDLNIDHQLLSKAVLTACRPMNDCSVEKLLFFEIPSSTEWNFDFSNDCFKPQYFSNVTEEFKLKKDALNAYESEMRPWPHPRSIKSIEMLAGWRGSMVGYEKAEAFSIAYYKNK